jgi:hypothetical protein
MIVCVRVCGGGKGEEKDVCVGRSRSRSRSRGRMRRSRGRRRRRVFKLSPYTPSGSISDLMSYHLYRILGVNLPGESGQLGINEDLFFR